MIFTEDYIKIVISFHQVLLIKISKEYILRLEDKMRLLKSLGFLYMTLKS